MNPLSRLLRIIATALVALTFGANTINAQDLDPVKVDPQHYKVIYENDEVRILSFNDTPGHFVPKHQHAHPFHVYSVTVSLRQFFQPDCVTKIGDPVLLAPDISSRPAPPVTHPPVIHCESNAGLTEAHLIVVEFKKNPPPTTTPTTAQQRRTVKPPRRTRR